MKIFFFLDYQKVFDTVLLIRRLSQELDFLEVIRLVRRWNKNKFLEGVRGYYCGMKLFS